MSSRIKRRVSARLAGQPDVLDAGTIGARALRRMKQHLNARQPLGNGVVNLPSETAALGQHPRLVLGGGELITGGDELGHEPLPLNGFARESLIAEADHHGDPGADERADHSADAPPTLNAERDDRQRERHDDGEDAQPRPQQVQVKKEEGKDEVRRLGNQPQQYGPLEGENAEPEHRRAVLV